MNTSQSIANLAVALGQAQKEMPKVKFDAKNPFLKNKYATLGALIETAKPILAKHGLSVSQFPTSQSNMVGVSTILMHDSGEFLQDTIYVLPEVSKGLSINQASGVTITYLRRYAYAAILGMYADEDNDGDTHGATGENADANESAKTLMSKRTWSPAQTEAIANISLERGLDPLTFEDARQILDLSVLPEGTPVKTIQSWFGRYLKSEADSPVLKAAEANGAYIEAKKNGGK